MFDKLDNLSVQGRVILATVVSLLFFIPYTYFITPQNVTTAENPTQKVEEQQQGSLPTNSAPKLSDTTTPAGAEAPIKDAKSGDVISVIKGKHFDIEIDSLGRISQVYLNDERFKTATGRVELFKGMDTLKPFEVRFSDQIINKMAFETKYSSDVKEVEIIDTPKEVTLTQHFENYQILKIFRFHPNGNIFLQIKTNIPSKYYISPGSRPSVDEDAFVFKGALIKLADDTLTTIEDGNAEKSEVFLGAKIAAMTDRYYASAIYSKEGMKVVSSKNVASNAELFIEGSGNYELFGYLGPKDYRELEKIDPILTSLVEYGFITFFAKPLFLLLDYLHKLVGNWGWAIVLLTLLVRLVMYPLTYKGMVSMQKLKELAPKVKEIQEKYKGDPQKMQLHMMDLYKKHGANPMGGCLPLILQMPIFFAIYRVLYNAIELKGAEWALWINDLSAMDPYFVLPILMGASMYLQQVMTPATFTDPMQEKIFKFLPLIFTFFFITFPSGLVLYWFVNNLFSIAQQYIINRSFEAKKRAKLETKE